MKVRFLGFKIDVGTIGLAEFLREQIQLSPKTFEHSSVSRLLYLREVGSEFVGLLLTIHDQKRFLELSTGKQFAISVRELNGTNRLVEFNYFIINTKTRKGLYQHYSGACGLTAFGNMLKKRYIQMIADRRHAQIAPRRSTLGKAGIRKVRQEIKGTLDLAAILTAEDFAELVKAMSRVQTISFAYRTPEIRNTALVPITDFLGRQVTTIGFKKGTAVGRIKDAAINLAKGKEFDNISVAGFDAAGDHAVYHTEANLTHFGKYEFDTLVTQKSIDLSDFAASPIVKMLRDAMTKNAIYFG